MNIINISDPESPQIAGFYDSGADAYGIIVSRHFAYLASGWDGLRIFGISLPYNPRPLGVFPTPENSYKVRVKSAYAYIANHGGGLLVLDVRDPSNPVDTARLSFASSSVREVKFSGDTALVALDNSGFARVRIFNPANPVKIDSFDTPGRVFDLAVDGERVAVADFSEGVRIYEPDPDTGLALIGVIEDIGRIRSVAIKGDFVYAGLDNPYVRVFDISVPSDPIKVDEVFTSRAYALHIQDDLLYVSAGYDGVHIFNISDPTELKEVGYYDTGGEVYDIAVVDDLLYLADLNAGMTILHFDKSTAVDDDKIAREAEAITLQNVFPNPSPGSVMITFSLDRPQRINISVFDANGRLVERLLNADRNPGVHTVVWDGRGPGSSHVSPGMYYVELRGPDHRQLRPVVIVDEKR